MHKKKSIILLSIFSVFTMFCGKAFGVEEQGFREYSFKPGELRQVFEECEIPIAGLESYFEKYNSKFNRKDLFKLVMQISVDVGNNEMRLGQGTNSQLYVLYKSKGVFEKILSSEDSKKNTYEVNRWAGILIKRLRNLNEANSIAILAEKVGFESNATSDLERKDCLNKYLSILDNNPTSKDMCCGWEEMKNCLLRNGAGKDEVRKYDILDRSVGKISLDRVQ